MVLKETPLKVRLRISLVEFTVETGYFISSCVFEWKRYKAEFWITQQTRGRYKAIESVLAVLLRQHAESIIESLNRSPKEF